MDTETPVLVSSSGRMIRPRILSSYDTPSQSKESKPSQRSLDEALTSISEKFETNVNGKIKWFPVPPIQVLFPSKPTHSLKYLVWKHKQENKKSAKVPIFSRYNPCHNILAKQEEVNCHVIKQGWNTFCV